MVVQFKQTEPWALNCWEYAQAAHRLRSQGGHSHSLPDTSFGGEAWATHSKTVIQSCLRLRFRFGPPFGFGRRLWRGLLSLRLLLRATLSLGLGAYEAAFH